MAINTANINSFWGSLIIEELHRSGVDYFCISPGSRSTPLTVAAVRNSRTRTIVCLDERGAAFHALGYARATAKPAALICTSGTAAANYYPAIIEAASDHLPLLVLTADRPPELRASGANQTIDQVKMFGDYPRWQHDLPCPDEQLSPRMLLTTIDQAVYQAIRTPGGPVHLNCMFREPLSPEGSGIEPQLVAAIADWRSSGRTYTTYVKPATALPADEMEAIAKVLSSEEQGIISVGRLDNAAERMAVARLASALRWPLFPDILSGLRLGQSLDCSVPYFDRIVQAREFCKRYRPHTILHFGGRMTSKRFYQHCEEFPAERYITVNASADRLDPTHRVTHHFEADVAEFCRSLLPMVTASPNDAWLAAYRKASAAVGQFMALNAADEDAVTEISAARIIARQIPADSALFLSSSMPVRDMDMFADAGGRAVALAANRGASGIDGIIASACGFAAGLHQTVTLHIGDLALLHDCNSLLQVRAIEQRMVIVLINNCGGGIFSFLPVARQEDVFEEFFATPHEANFEAAARMAGLAYCAPASNVDFRQAYARALESEASTIIELRTDRSENRALHARVQSSISALVDGLAR